MRLSQQGSTGFSLRQKYSSLKSFPLRESSSEASYQCYRNPCASKTRKSCDAEKSIRH
ncbi:MAG: hypothetical protein RL042_2109 [Nitrospirota bacterium]